MKVLSRPAFRWLTLFCQHWTILLAIPSSLFGSALTADTDSVAHIDHEELTVAEYQLFVANRKAEFASRYFQSKDVIDAPAWATQVDGRSVAARLKEAALADALQAKARQVLYKEYGLLDELSWPVFLAELARENERRGRAIARGSPVYGPATFSPRAYYRYRDAHLALRLSELLRTREAGPSETWERTFYATYRTSLFTSRTGILPFDQVQGVIQARYFEDRVVALTRARLAAARVEVNGPVLAALLVE
jgi:hypothetical protein